MPRNKLKQGKKYTKSVRKNNMVEKKLETDTKMTEDAKESDEVLGIDDEEEHDVEAYPEIENTLGNEDNPEKEDDE